MENNFKSKSVQLLEEVSSRTVDLKSVYRWDSSEEIVQEGKKSKDAIVIAKVYEMLQSSGNRKLSARTADLLVLELEVAARRTGGISSVPAFLTEVLRRQFFASRQQQSSGKPAKAKIDTVGEYNYGSYEIKPLDAKEREVALEQLREFSGDDFLEDFKKWYTTEDWDYLIKKLEE